MWDSAKLHKQKFQQQLKHYKVALLSKDTQWYSKEMLHIPHEVQLNLHQLFVWNLRFWTFNIKKRC